MSSSKLQFAQRISSIQSDDEFWEMAGEVFELQSTGNNVFADFLASIRERSTLSNLPFPLLPIEAFKYDDLNYSEHCDTIFRSSGTSGSNRSTHKVFDQNLYTQLSQKAFERIHGPLTDWVILALLPSYLENGESSLVHMVNTFIINSKNKHSSFVEFNAVSLSDKLEKLKAKGQKTMLIGVSYALLDFCETTSFAWNDLHIMETGGMKGRRRELTRPELHANLKQGFPLSHILSEYGMTELLSQGYSTDGTWFSPPPWMHAMAIDVSDPFHMLEAGQRGLLGFIDLANVHSCSFIQTRDIGIVRANGSFSVEGRLDNTELRGCNLLYT